ncbi:hypothetical protein SDC9_83155 [bioreactor metagenome]|uniref:Uncharacterized protein n=1 Tax=bioreactor metagenome TaxID=1076179 RepID=A0A644Z6R9_9ZZZZ
MTCQVKVVVSDLLRVTAVRVCVAGLYKSYLPGCENNLYCRMAKPAKHLINFAEGGEVSYP